MTAGALLVLALLPGGALPAAQAAGRSAAAGTDATGVSVTASEGQAGISAPAAADATLVVNLRREAAVRGKWIRLGDVAELSGVSGDRLAALAELKLAHAPLPGAEKVLGTEELRRRLRGLGVGDTIVLAGEPAARITLAVRAVPGADLVRVAQERLLAEASRPGVAIEVVAPETPRAITVPDGQVELKAEVPRRRLAGLVPVAVEVHVGGEAAARVLLSFRVKAQVKAPRAVRDLTPGDVIAPADLAEGDADLAALPDDVATGADALVGLRVLRPVPAGSWVRRSALAQPLKVRRNGSVTLIARIGTVEARAAATSKEDGAAGDVVTVVNASSRRMLKARVLDQDLVEAVMP